MYVRVTCVCVVCVGPPGPSAAFRASCVCVRVTCVCVKCVWAASMSAVGCPVARLVPSASVTAGGGPSSQLLGLALG